MLIHDPRFQFTIIQDAVVVAVVYFLFSLEN